MSEIFAHIFFHDNFAQKTRSTKSIYFFKDTVRRPRVFKNPFLIAMSSHENRNTHDRITGCRVFTLGFTTTGFSMGLLRSYFRWQCDADSGFHIYFLNYEYYRLQKYRLPDFYFGFYYYGFFHGIISDFSGLFWPTGMTQNKSCPAAKNEQNDFFVAVVGPKYRWQAGIARAGV